MSAGVSAGEDGLQSEHDNDDFNKASGQNQNAFPGPFQQELNETLKTTIITRYKVLSRIIPTPHTQTLFLELNFIHNQVSCKLMNLRIWI